MVADFFSTKTFMQMFRLSHNIYFVCLMLFIYHYYITKPNILASCLVLFFSGTFLTPLSQMLMAQFHKLLLSLDS